MIEPHRAGALVQELLASGTSVRLRVTGRSMRPFLSGGETIHIECISPAAVRRGDLILIHYPPDNLLLHRVVRIICSPSGELVFQTRGDALARPDQPVPAACVLGRALAVADGSRTVSLDEIRRAAPHGWRLHVRGWLRRLLAASRAWRARTRRL